MTPGSIADLQKALLAKKTSVLSIVKHYLEQIASTSDLNIYVRVFEKEAIEKASALDDKIQNGEPVGKLAGLVLSVKDVICIEGQEVSAASKMLEGFQSLFTATALQRLLDEDAIVIGMVNCDEFAMGSANENSVFGPVKNPLDPERIPGGSSGGSAAAVAADTCLISLGSDTGGSVRQPASFCGVSGFKPSYGRISRYGLIAYASSFDQIGVIGNSPDDIYKVLQIMEGEDEMDATSTAFMNYTPSKEKIIGWIPEIMNHPGLDPDIKNESDLVMEKLKDEGYELKSFDFPLLDYIIPTYYIMTAGESSSNLSRYDGVRYGHQTKENVNLENFYRKSRAEGFGSEVKRRIMMGTFVLSAGFYDQYFGKAQKVRRMIKEAMENIFMECDYIICPVSPVRPWKIGEKIEDPVSVYLSDIYTVIANLAGVPAISIPLKSMSSPYASIQLLGPKGSDHYLLTQASELLKKF
ncbi:MAG: Asp-tRNA(Asn)/Glu-tRNA(Gln) amidotransferase subunit GatA [Saprospiraceae bacterium]